MTRLDDVLQRVKPPASRHWARLVIALLAGLVTWSYFAQFEEVAVATGEVVPMGQIKTVQHLEGGIIEKIYVVEGDRVKKGDPLVQLDLLSSDTNREEFAVRLDGFVLVAARLNGEAHGVAPDFPADVGKRRATLLRTERETYAARQRELNSALDILRQQVRQRELEVKQLRARKKAVTTDLRLAREEFTMSVKLLARGLTPKVDHLRLERGVQSLEGEVSELLSTIPRSEAGVLEAKGRIQQEEFKFRRRAGEELGVVEGDIAQTREALARAMDRVRRMEIRSPIDGIVKSQRYHTIGGIVRPGEAIMEIVPTEKNLVIEARLSPADVGYVRAGQPAVTKISTYDFVRYGGLEGRVVNVSPDSDTDASGATYFRVVVRTDRTYLGDSPGEFPITAGMEATVDIQTGRKSVLEYMLTPVLKLKSEAFRER